jgi:hypothetical protein
MPAPIRTPGWATWVELEGDDDAALAKRVEHTGVTLMREPATSERPADVTASW